MGTLHRTIRAGELIQINNIIGEIDPSPNEGVYRLELESDAPIFAEVFRVNQYGDPVTIDPS